MSFIIRHANHADIETLVELRIALLQEVGNIEVEDDIQKVSAANKMYYEKNLLTGEIVSFIAEAQGEIIGTSGLILITRPPHLHNLSGIDAYIMNMYTLPNWRGKGIAKALLDACIEFAKSNNVGRIALDASSDGKLVYEKRGFILKNSAMELVLNG
ncbi:GNAT family N-acetyltransferase [Paenibacillus sp. Soil522]|uniref:GNAT family N-acetyltransferase n=1 Tax=Paenibacillus sp. Soil522 TaxID=1736388 RepID=UPI0006FE8E7C|nr:GNAT family N-acetyltransferase [Paenibacillus sp. Soil522]KRE29649.1 hypothetical protein ASG81_25450 [Paenibacillus sp. Soil522]